MHCKLLVLASILLVTTAYAEEPKAYQDGKVLQVDSVSCGARKTRQQLCHEYLLQTDKVIYRIRPSVAKHPALLPIGEQAQFRMDRGKMLLRVQILDSKEREYIVVSTTPRGDRTADVRPVRLNHLQ
jgi:hypothetical protein